jgi:GntR family transcriptional repressor for pyruvate dehydrogenase complex
MRVWRGIADQGAIDRTIAEHRAILDALHRRDPELARSWATVHVAGVEEWVRSALEAGRALDAGPYPAGAIR